MADLLSPKILDIIQSPVTIITTKYKEEANGMTAAWVAQVSYNPTLVIVSIAPERYTHQLIQLSKIFAINLLSQDQIKLAKYFGTKSGKNTDKFQAIKYTTKASGAPILDEIYGYIDCKVLSGSRIGDHTVFTGQVLQTEIFPTKKPLIFKSKDYF